MLRFFELLSIFSLGEFITDLLVTNAINPMYCDTDPPSDKVFTFDADFGKVSLITIYI